MGFSAVALQKGGLGKATTAINLSYEFGPHGLSRLLIDLSSKRTPQTAWPLRSARRRHHVRRPSS
ncbi:AAA family ATPase [Mycobacterium intracellulare]|uniref:AAA family ATPase n=1 Tax=Mycobacterium intracellulare TaxID=1767 RepID=UPI001156F6FB